MNRRTAWILGAVGLVGWVAACSTTVDIHKETGETSTATSSTSSSGSTNMQGSGGSTTSSSSSSSSSGTMAGPGKIVAADSDMAQYQSLTTNVPTVNTSQGVKIAQGPFFVTDVFIGQNVPTTLATVTGADCTGPQSEHTTVLVVPGFGSAFSQIHGIRLPIMAGQSLCLETSAGSNPGLVTVLGYKPY